MIVIAIIGILAALAIPAYQDYLVRTQASEGLAMASAAKAVGRGVLCEPWRLARQQFAAGIGSATDIEGKYVTSITIADGGITVTYGNEANTRTCWARTSACSRAPAPTET